MPRTALSELRRVDAGVMHTANTIGTNLRRHSIQVDDLKRATTAATVALLQSYNGAGSVGPLHHRAIERMVQLIFDTAAANPGADCCRVLAIPAPTGLCKSTVTMAVCAALASTVGHGLRVAVLTTSIRDLLALFDGTCRLLLGRQNHTASLTQQDRRHPNLQRLGLIHHDINAAAVHAPTDEASISECSVVFATQQKARGANGEQLFAGVSLAVLDEDLGCWSTDYQTMRSIRHAENILRSSIENRIIRFDDREALECCGRYLAECRAAVEAAAGSTGVEVRLPIADLFTTTEGRRPVETTMQLLAPMLKRQAPGIDDIVMQLVKWSGSPVDVRTANYDGAAETVLSFRSALPSWMQRVIQLDAQAGHDSFKRLSPEIESDQWFLDHYDALKSYSGSRIHWASVSSSRESVEQQLKSSKGKSELLSMLLQVVTKHVADDEAILIATFKNNTTRRHNNRRVDPDLYINNAKQYLADHGIDPEQRLPNGQQRFCFATWGSLKATNQFVHCSHFFTLGLLRRSPEDLICQAVAATGRGDIHHPTIDLRTILANELSRELVQAANRTCARTIVNGNAKPMTLWLLMRAERGLGEMVLSELEIQMPGIQRLQWPGQAAAGSKMDRIADAVQKFLATFDGDLIRTTEIRKGASQQLGFEVQTFDMSRTITSRPHCADGWQVVPGGRSWKRAA